MKVLFFDMEFANGQVHGSIYSIGTLVTSGHFHILKKPNDILMSPDCKWNMYVVDKILCYKREFVDAQPKFTEFYQEIKNTFEKVDLAVGFAVKNDTTALYCDCQRYHLEPISYKVLDVERLCKELKIQNEGQGLSGLVKTICGFEPENVHRSDGDALATMQLLKTICKQQHCSLKGLMKKYPSCISSSPLKINEKKKR